jgi:hypothetical protein
MGLHPPFSFALFFFVFLIPLLTSTLYPLSHFARYLITWSGLFIMGVGNLMARFKPGSESQFSSQAPTPARADSTVEKNEGIIDDSPVKYLTWRSFILGLCVSMGGFIFGYSTGKLVLHTSLVPGKWVSNPIGAW